VPVIGVIEPGARGGRRGDAYRQHRCDRNRGNDRQRRYERAIKALRPDAKVHGNRARCSYRSVEEGWFEHPAAELIAREYLEPLKRAKVDVLVLGCTHYPLLKPLLARVMGADVTLVDSAEETATAVARELERLDPARDSGSHEHRFVVSDDEPAF